MNMLQRGTGRWFIGSANDMHLISVWRSHTRSSMNGEIHCCFSNWNRHVTSIWLSVYIKRWPFYGTLKRKS